MEDLYSALPYSGHMQCTFLRVAQSIANSVIEKIDPHRLLVILMADDSRRCPPPRKRLRIKRMQAKPFAPSSLEDAYYWGGLAQACTHLDSLLVAGTAAEQELEAAWTSLCRRKLPIVRQLDGLMRTQPAVKHVLLTKVSSCCSSTSSRWPQMVCL
jgi:hypothetical protein